MARASSPTLPLEDLEIRQFRCFEYLRIERLGRVNLIVGKNNTGKSSLLEALRLYASVGSTGVLWDILAARDEDKQGYIEKLKDKIPDVLALLSLFHGRKRLSEINSPVEIGTGQDKLAITLEWFREVADEREGPRLQRVGQPAPGEITPDLVPAIVISLGSMRRRLRLDREFRRDRAWLGAEFSGEPAERCVYVGANGL